MSKALITGAAGFVGRWLSKELSLHGYTLVETDHTTMDITQQDQVYTIISKEKPTHIFHLAGISSPSFAEIKQDMTYAVHIEGTQNVLDAALTLCEKPRILIVGSCYTYGTPQALPITERHPLDGKGIYADSRIKQEALVSTYFDKLPIIITRSFNHTGPGQTEAFVIAKFVKQLAEIKKGKRSFMKVGNLKIKRDISDVRDVVKVYRLLLEQHNFGEIVNVCRGKSITLQNVVDKIVDYFMLDFHSVQVSKEFIRKNDVLDLYGDTKKLNSLIERESLIGYDTMIKDLCFYWDQNA